MIYRVKGSTIGNYYVERIQDDGGHATVYVGRHTKLHTWVALKILREEYAREQGKIDEFYQEARRMANLRHPYIVRVYECDKDGDHYYYAMDLAHGTLRQYCRPDNLLPLHLVVRYIKQAAEALQYVHQQGFIHRDVKPENLLISPRRTIWLCDFGISVAMHGKAYAVTRHTRGTVGYMASEHYRHLLYPASDQYALAVVAYELLVGTGPFHGTSTQVAQQHQHTHPPSLRTISPSIPLAVERVVMKALSKKPDDRYSDVMTFANELVRAYQAYASGQSSRLGLHAPRQSASRPSSMLPRPVNAGNTGSARIAPIVAERSQLASKYSEPLQGFNQSSEAFPSRLSPVRPVVARHQRQSSALHPIAEQSRQVRHPRPVQASRHPVVASRQRTSPHPGNSIKRAVISCLYGVIVFGLAGVLHYCGFAIAPSLLIAFALFLVTQTLVLPKR